MVANIVLESTLCQSSKTKSYIELKHYRLELIWACFWRCLKSFCIFKSFVANQNLKIPHLRMDSKHQYFTIHQSKTQHHSTNESQSSKQIKRIQLKPQRTYDFPAPLTPIITKASPVKNIKRVNIKKWRGIYPLTW